MLQIVVAVFLALSLIGGGVVYAAETAPPTSPLHPVQVAVNDTASHLHLANSFSANAATATPRPGKHAAGAADDSADSDAATGKDASQPKPTMTPLPPAVATSVTTIGADLAVLRNDPSVPGHNGNGPENGLMAKLDAVQNDLGRGDHQSAADTLDAFVHQLNALERSGHISQANYSALYEQYAGLLKLVNANATPIPSVTPHAHGPAGQGIGNGKGKHGESGGATQSATSSLATPTPTPGPPGRGNGKSPGK